MKIEKIKPIPKYILKKIQQKDKQLHPKPDGHVRFYSYLTKNDGELVKVTVAVKHKYKTWHYKQVAVHGLDSDTCFVKDMTFYYIGGYSVGWYEEGLTKAEKWYEDSEWGWSEDRYFDPYATCINKEYASTISGFKYCALDLFPGHEVIKYLRMYRKYPQVEYLTKLGLHAFVFSKQVLSRLGKDKRFRKWIAKHREQLKSNRYYISTVLSAYRKGEAPDEVQAYEEAKKLLITNTGFAQLREFLNKGYEAYFQYVGKQKISNALYADYLRACLYLGLDMSQEKNRYPKDFHRWHEIRTDEYRSKRAEEDKKKRAELYAQFEAVAQKYMSLQKKQRNGGYMVIIARSPQELVAEGEALHHCVGRMGYDQKFAREQSLIFFVRDMAHPDTPLVTIEYSPSQKRIQQCYADHNSSPSEAIQQFIKKTWLPYANKQLQKIAA